MTTDNIALNDELEAVNSIYGSEALLIDSTNSEDSVSAILTLPEAPFSFSLTFPHSYPDVPPLINGTHHVGADIKKGQGETAVNIVRDVLGKIYIPGQVCLFDLIEEVSSLLEQSGPHDETATSENDGTTEGVFGEGSTAHRSESPAVPSQIKPSTLTDTSSTVISTPPPNWTLSEPLQVNKSTFIGRSLAIESLEEAKTSLSHLLSTNKKVASATHNITAWRIRQRSTPDSPEITIQDCDDDGETAAGGRLLHLMQMMDVWNCMVVVTRWYGGVKLGPDRFRCINMAARETLVNGGFVKEDKDGGKSSKGKKR